MAETPGGTHIGYLVETELAAALIMKLSHN